MSKEVRKPAKTYRDLLVWQKAKKVARAVYEVTRAFPREERFGLTSQMRSSALSIPSNVAEGFGRRGPREYVRFLLIARGSVFELETQLEIAMEVSMLPEDKYHEVTGMLDEVERILEALIRSVERNTSK